VSGYTVQKVARNGKLYQRKFWLSGPNLRTNGRFSAGVALVELTGVFCGAVSDEFLRFKQAPTSPVQGSGPASLLRRSLAGSNKSTAAMP
ncbi:unnamed protein product, partial [Polarella glacialis]